MRPHYLEKWEDSEGSNREIATCHLCGREELIAKGKELVKCSICCQMGTTQKQEPSLKGKDIKALREKMGVSLKSLCDDLKIDKSLFLKIERGEKPVNSTLIKWYQNHTPLNAQNSPLNTGHGKDISTYQPPPYFVHLRSNTDRGFQPPKKGV